MVFFFPYWQFHYLNYGFWFCVSMRFLCVKIYLVVYMCFCAFYLALYSMFIDFFVHFQFVCFIYYYYSLDTCLFVSYGEIKKLTSLVAGTEGKT